MTIEINNIRINTEAIAYYLSNSDYEITIGLKGGFVQNIVLPSNSKNYVLSELDRIMDCRHILTPPTIEPDTFFEYVSKIQTTD